MLIIFIFSSDFLYIVAPQFWFTRGYVKKACIKFAKYRISLIVTICHKNKDYRKTRS